MKHSIQPYMSSCIRMEVVASRGTLWDRFLIFFGSKRSYYCDIRLFKPNWSCLATYSQDENTPYNHTFRHTSGGSWLHKVITSGSIFDLFSGQKQHGFVGYFQMGRFFKPNWSCLTTYSHNETLHTTIHVVMHPNGGGCIKGNTLGSILDLFWVEKIILL